MQEESKTASPLEDSAKNFYDTQSSELTEMSAKIVLVDRVLAHYGPETKELRDLCRAQLPECWIGFGRRALGTSPSGTDGSRRRNSL